MKALFYIIYKSLVNTLKELIKKPGKLVLYLLVVAIIVGLILLTVFTATETPAVASVFGLTGFIFAFITLFVVMGVVKGVSNGDVIFEMNDVNLLFVSPVSPQKILFYGILRLAKLSFFACFFVLFQSAIFSDFGLGFRYVLLTMGIFVVTMVVLSMVSLVIYSMTNGNNGRKRLVKIICFFVFAPLLCYFVLSFFNSQDIWQALEQVIYSPFMRFIPLAGWTAASLTGFFAGDMLTGFLFLGLIVLLGLVLVAYIILSKLDYYEDTLVATETAFEKKRAIQEGDLNAATTSTAKVKVSRTGVSGFGSSALFYRHMRESFRESPLGFISIPHIIGIVAGILFAFFMRDLVNTMQILMWMQVFVIGTGKGLKETYVHYIYMIPESSFKKIIWSNMEVMLLTLVESVLIFGIGGILIGAPVLLILACIVTFTLFAFLLLGTNYVFMRFTGANVSKGLLITIYYLALIIVMLPGVIPALVVGFSIGGVTGALIGLSILAVWEVIAGSICFFLSRGVLHKCDMPSMVAKT